MKMVTVKTSELSGVALDYATALALGKRPNLFIFQQTGGLAKEHNYSTNWAQAGPIIERGNISLTGENSLHDFWTAVNQHGGHRQDGATPLIAAMRCYVTSKLGDSVEVPSELF